MGSILDVSEHATPLRNAKHCFGNGLGTFQGLIDECIIYGDLLSDDAMATNPLIP